jgi:DNA-binding LacI/PurR family transcriptional regulator
VLAVRQSTSPTLDAVAARAGVGRGTVSRVINGGTHVSQRAREAVEQAIAELGYVPNRAARSLVTRRGDAVALVVSEPETPEFSEFSEFSEAFCAGIIRGVSAELNETDLQLLLIMAQTAPDRERLQRFLSARHADGVLLVSLQADDPLPGVLARIGMPFVLAGRRPAGGQGEQGASFVDADHEGGAYQVVRHLLQTGRQRVATITGPRDMDAGIQRLAGYRRALEEDGRFDPQLVARGDFSAASGRWAMRRLLSTHPDIDAVFAASDPMAAGALAALREEARSVPGDVAVAGFDDSIIAQHTIPPLTSVRQPVEQMGRRMARLLIERMHADPAAPPAEVVLTTRLVRRESG